MCLTENELLYFFFDVLCNLVSVPSFDCIILILCDEMLVNGIHLVLNFCFQLRSSTVLFQFSEVNYLLFDVFEYQALLGRWTSREI